MLSLWASAAPRHWPNSHNCRIACSYKSDLWASDMAGNFIFDPFIFKLTSTNKIMPVVFSCWITLCWILFSEFFCWSILWTHRYTMQNNKPFDFHLVVTNQLVLYRRATYFLPERKEIIDETVLKMETFFCKKKKPKKNQTKSNFFLQRKAHKNALLCCQHQNSGIFWVITWISH